MSGTSGLFGTGLSGLLAAQAGLTTAGHNIANVDTAGFTRQRVDLVSNESAGAAAGFLGAGVEVASVRRIYDGFLASQLRVSTAALSELDTYQGLAAEIDGLLGEESGSLSPALQSFFASLHGVADDPASMPARQVALSEADALVRRFRTLDQRLDQQRQAIAGRLSNLVGEINSHAEGIATLNRRIVAAEAGTGGEANDLRDQRDEMIRSLAERVGVNVYAQDDGSLNVATGSGQMLVVGATAGKLGLTRNAYDPSRQEIVFTAAGGSSGIISDLLSGGQIGAVLGFRGEVLDSAQNALGRVALAVSHAVNVQHRLGTDLDGAGGGDLFTDLDTSAARVFAHAGNTGNASIGVEVLDTAALTTSDYRLARSGASYTLTRSSDGKVSTLAGFPGTDAVVDGLRVSLAAGSIASGDSFLLQPTRFAASATGVEVLSVRGLAAAAPVRASTSLANAGDVQVQSLRVNSPEARLEIRFANPPGTFDVVEAGSGATLASAVGYVPGATHTYNGTSFTLAGAAAAGDRFALERGVGTAEATNTGTATIGGIGVGSADPNLTDPVTITFDNPPGTFTVTGSTTGTPVAAVPYTSGDPISFNGWTLTLAGTPAAGDTVSVGANSAGIGDNRNALALVELQSAGTLEGGAGSFEESYGQEVTRVGLLTRQAEVNADAQRAVHDQVTQAREARSGVNLDEEAADLLKYQRAYQASAQMLAVANEVFGTLIQVVSR